MSMVCHPRWRPFRWLASSVFLVILIFYFAKGGHRYRKQPHVLRPDLYRWSTIGPSQHLLLPDKIDGYCKAHGFKEFKAGSRPRKIYDLFLFSYELDWLEIRLHTLSPFVDFFVIVESRTTFTGYEKPAYLADNWDRFAPFHSKIIHRVIEDPGAVLGDSSWAHEDYLRNALFQAVFPELVGTWREPALGDVLLVSDVDEIPKPEALVVLRKCSFPDRLTLRSFFYYYSFQWLHRGEQWPHPQATVYKGLEDTIPPKDLRNGEPTSHGLFYMNHLKAWLAKVELGDAGYHCSSCFPTLKEMQLKMQSFSHTKWNTPDNRDPQTIIGRVRNGKDLFGREGEVYDKVIGNLDVPAYIQQHPERFGYLLNRDGANAAFTDVLISDSGQT